jgi:ArsR family transcriptional regulator
VKVEGVNRKRSEDRSKVIKALAHPSRILLAEALSEKECCVQDLTELVGSDISTVSKHLAVMKNAGLVVARKEGLRQYYRICCGCLTDFFGCVDQIAESAPD